MRNTWYGIVLAGLAFLILAALALFILYALLDSIISDNGRWSSVCCLTVMLAYGYICWYFSEEKAK